MRRFARSLFGQVVIALILGVLAGILAPEWAVKLKPLGDGFIKLIKMIIPVTILETKQEALDRGVATIRKNYEAQVKKGKLTQEKYDQRMALLSTTLSYDALKNADLIIE